MNENPEGHLQLVALPFVLLVHVHSRKHWPQEISTDTFINKKGTVNLVHNEYEDAVARQELRNVIQLDQVNFLRERERVTTPYLL